MIASFTPRLVFSALAFVGLAALASVSINASTGEEARRIPPPAVDEPASPAGSEVAVVAGGCFWGVQGVFQHVDGVVSAVSGYDGGAASTAHYEMTSRGDTGHAESVRITYDPHKITYGKILQIFFSVAHDPTELNRQGPDEGTQYRSAIFPSDAEQARVAKAYIARARSGACLRRADRDDHRNGQDLLSRRGLSSGFPGEESAYPYIVDQRPAEDRGPEAAVPGALPGRPGAGRGEIVATCHPRESGDPSVKPDASGPPLSRG